ncbi:hypothetical protein D9M69_692570 [compost metagenome]
MFFSSTGRPPSTSSPLCSLLSHMSSFTVWRKYSPASGSISAPQRSNMRYDLTNSSLAMLSHSCTSPAPRPAGRSMSKEANSISGGTLPTVSMRRSTSK